MNARAEGADLAPSLSGRRLGRYEVLTQLASGGMAAVYVARAQGVAGFERLVAIKVLHPHIAHEQEFISMFLDEARLAARIRHPNVVATLDVSDTHGAGYFLVMDYIEGDHLGALLRAAVQAGHRLPVPVTVRIMHDALSGLGAAHDLTDETGTPLQLVHRDISPHNIMVGTDGIARLTDFGVAKAEVRLSSTREGQFKGKLSYMAPEHASTGQADQRSDLFSMGIVLWESLTGQRLFRAENNAQTLHKILHEPIPAPSSVLPELEPFDAVVAKAMARPPAERFQTADEFMEALEEAGRTANGSATTRQVASVVKKLVGEKLAQENHRIRKSIEDLGHSQVGEVLLPLPVEGSGSHVSMPRAVDPDAVTRAARPGTLAEREPRPRRGLLWLAVIVLLLVAGGTVVALLSSGAEQEALGPEVVTPPGAAAGPITGGPVEPPPEQAAPQDPAAAGTGTAGPGEAPPEATAEPPEAAADPAVIEPEPARTERRRRPAQRRDRPARMREEPEDDLLSNPYRR